MGRCQPGRCTLLRRGWGLGVTGTRETSYLVHKHHVRHTGAARWVSGSKKGPTRASGPCGRVLTSHVLHGAVKHKIEQWVEPLQDAAGL